MTRDAAAAVIAEALEAGGYSASAWTTDASGPVRVYVTIPAASYKKKSRQIGFVSVELDGSISGDDLEIQKGSILALIPELQIEMVATKPVGSDTKTRHGSDEISAAFEDSERAVYASESAREQG